jgi:DNA-binding MarR family transcriptional regulator
MAAGQADPAREVWRLMSDLVLDHQRRREVSEAVGLSFGRVRLVRRVADRPMTMGELADALGIDRPNATVVVDDLEAQGLVRRKPHPTDRRAKLVEATGRGKTLARRADKILSRPPAKLASLDSDDLEALRRILTAVRPDTGDTVAPARKLRGPRARSGRARGDPPDQARGRPRSPQDQPGRRVQRPTMS